MRSEYVKACGTCVHLVYLVHNGECYCEHKGPVSENGKCGKYRFDLLKIRPSAPVCEIYDGKADI